jgi:hypothetical protein
MIIKTNPPGALCFVDDNEVGLTPVAVSPIYYGQRKIRLVKDGYETQEFIQAVPAPWYEITPLDFFVENVIPGKILDQRTYDFQLYPQGVVPQEELLGRAENLRRGTQTATGALPGYQVNPSSPGQTYLPPTGNPGGAPIGGQPFHQLPSTTDRGAVPDYPPPFPAVSTGPTNYTPPPPVGQSNFGSQPYHALPAGG